MRTAISDQDRRLDRALATIGQSFRFLVDVTPTNVSQARRRYLADPGGAPEFEYRDVGDLADRVRGQLNDLDLSTASDPTLTHLFERKSAELRLQAEMLDARDTEEFLPLSIELFGAVSPRLVGVAERILELVPAVPTPQDQCLSAEHVAMRMTEAFERYRPAVGQFDFRVLIRDDIAGVMVSNGVVLIAEGVQVSSSRIAALLAHEIDTHVLTYINGSQQALTLLAAGLAGYEETQEGLALTAEIAVDGLTAARIRQLAARVIAVHGLIQRAAFRDVHRELVDGHGFSPSGGFGITMRAFRSGGLTKDAGYLRALRAMVEHLDSGGELDGLWMGKMALTDLPLVQELRERGVLSAPAVLPHFLGDWNARERMAEFASAVGMQELIGVEQ